MTEEIKKTIFHIKNGKSLESDNLHREFFKLLEEEGNIWLTNLFNKIYSTRKLSTIWLKSTFTALPKNTVLYIAVTSEPLILLAKC